MQAKIDPPSARPPVRGVRGAAALRKTLVYSLDITVANKRPQAISQNKCFATTAADWTKNKLIFTLAGPGGPGPGRAEPDVYIYICVYIVIYAFILIYIYP